MTYSRPKHVDASQFATALNAAKRTGVRVYPVGGTVRDLLLGRDKEDIDLCVSGRIEAFCDELAKLLSAHVVKLHDDPPTFRIARRKGTIDVVPVGQSLAANLRQRDFTINAMALVQVGDAWRVEDPTGGMQDLEAGVVRMVSEDVLDADPIRLLRAHRIAAELGFAILPETARAIATRAGSIRRVAAERISLELNKTLATPRAAQALEGMWKAGLLFELFPELKAAEGHNGGGRHHLDVLSHSLETVRWLDVLIDRGSLALADVVACCEPEAPGAGIQAVFASIREESLRRVRSRVAVLKLAGLLHDVAKPETAQPKESGGLSFAGHSERGAEVARSVCRRLRMGSRETQYVADLVRYHLRPSQLAREQRLTDRAIRRLRRDLGAALPDVLALALSDRLATRGGATDKAQLQHYLRVVERLADAWLQSLEPAARRPRLLTGRDVIREFGLEPGPAVGRLLAALEEAQDLGEVRTPQEAKALATRLLAEDEHGTG